MKNITKSFIETLIQKNGCLNGKAVKQLQSENPLITVEYLFCVYNDIQPQKCSMCDNVATFISFTKGYKENCSIKCSNANPKNSTKRVQSRKEKYGEHYEISVQKTKKTNLEKYGVESTNQVEHIKQKKKESFTKKYGENITNASHIPEVLKKIENIKLKRYNDKHFNNRKQFKQTMQKSYGVDYGRQIFIKNIEELYSLDNTSIEKFIENNLFLVDKFCEYFNVSINMVYFIKNKLNLTIQNKSDKNKTQTEIQNFIEIFNVNCVSNDRKILNGKELDIVCDNFTVEYNGLMFHSYGISKHSMFSNAHEEDKNYHLNKTELCEEKGYQLFHIFENEWINIETQRIWKSMLKSKMNKSFRIFARKTIIKEISSSVAREFCIENHLQGYSNSSIRLGLFYNEELVSVMTFAKPRYSKKYEYELIRFCTKTGLNIVGGASKLLKYFERTYNPKSLISYANRRWSQGGVYEKLGFEFSHNTEPGYFYFLEKEYKLLGRTEFQKHKLKKFESYSEERTESEIMFLEGYRRIWDCGNKVYTKSY